MESHVIGLGSSNLVLLKEKNGYIMCGLLNIQRAEELGQAAAMVTGVKTAEDALAAEVKAATTKARELGVKPGMKGREALKLMS